MPYKAIFLITGWMQSAPHRRLWHGWWFGCFLSILYLLTFNFPNQILFPLFARADRFRRTAPSDIGVGDGGRVVRYRTLFLPKKSLRSEGDGSADTFNLLSILCVQGSWRYLPIPSSSNPADSAPPLDSCAQWSARCGFTFLHASTLKLHKIKLFRIKIINLCWHFG